MSAAQSLPLGDGAITFRFGEGISETLSATVVSRAKAIEAAGIVGVTDIVPSYAALTVYYDARVISCDDILPRLEVIAAEPERPEDELSKTQSRLHRIPVVYDGEDIDEVAARTGMTRDDVVILHSDAEYRVFVTGFVPGFAYLGILDERLSLPRRESPRKRVPAGSVAIAERQTGVYPSVTPGGWHIVGTTTTSMFDPSAVTPALLQVGDRVKFEPLG
jgi:KipI family sensor histidine kinase inhibitor